MSLAYQKDLIKAMPESAIKYMHNSSISHSPNPQMQIQKQKKIFLTKAQRFSHNERHLFDTPGPGSYQSLFKDKHTTDYHVNKKAGKSETIDRQHQWILRSKFQNASYKDSNIGPGMYGQNEGNTNDYRAQHSNWSKGQRFNYYRNNKETLPGPGIYNPEGSTVTLKENGNNPVQSISQLKHKKNKQLSVFKSKSPKTFFQQILHKQKKSISQRQKSSTNEQQQENRRVAIKFDQTQYPARKTSISNKLSPMFNSNTKRPELLVHQECSEYVGPGSYLETGLEYQKANKYQVFNKYKAISSAIHYNLNPQEIAANKSKLESKLKPPGPGSYNIESKMAMSQSKSSLVSSLAKQQRFMHKSASKQKIPGPGQYMKNRFTMIDEQEMQSMKKRMSFVRKAEKVHDFGTAARGTLRNRNQVPFGEYNLHNYNLDYKLHKQREHLQKLKLMEVTLPAFNTKLKRKD